MTNLNYKLMFFPGVNRYVGYAWLHREATIIATVPQHTRDAAKMALDEDCRIRGFVAHWFMGNFLHDPEAVELREVPELP